MTTLNDNYDHAELALAAYASLDSNLSSNEKSNRKALENAGMTGIQAAGFSLKYPIIVSHIANTEWGFSATVFKSSTGELEVAFRGSPPLSA